MKLMRYFTLAALAALLGLGGSLASWSGGALAQAQECTVTVQPGESIQKAINQAAEGDVICLAEGTWEENIKIEKSLTLRGVDVERTIIDGVRRGYPVAQIVTSEVAHEVTFVKLKELTITGAPALWVSGARKICADPVNAICAAGVLIRGSARIEIASTIISKNTYAGISILSAAVVRIASSTISENGWGGIRLRDQVRVEVIDSSISNSSIGIIVWDSAQAEIIDSTITGNRAGGIWIGVLAEVQIIGLIISRNGGAGVSLSESVRITMVSNEVIRNGGYGVALRQRPCYDTDEVFTGHVSGKQNTIPGPEEPDGNGKGAVCPSPELGFLMTEEGGEYP
jgi:parallel beta-helix repeat protein